MRILIFALFTTVLLASCVTPKPAPGAFAAAEQAIAAAMAAGAEEYSPVELRFAREKLEEAHLGMERKQYDKSIYLVEQAQINAELAVEKSRAAQIRARVTDLARENEIMREEFEANFGPEFGTGPGTGFREDVQ